MICSNSRGGVLEGRGEHLLHPVVDLLDHGEQVAPGLLQVLQLRRPGTRAVPPARRTPPGPAGSPCRADRAGAARLRPAAPARPGRRAWPAGRPRRRGTATSGPYSPISASASTPNSSAARAAICSSCIRRVARSISAPCALPTTVVEFVRQFADPGPDRLQLAVAPMAGLLGCLPLAVRIRRDFSIRASASLAPSATALADRGRPPPAACSWPSAAAWPAARPRPPMPARPPRPATPGAVPRRS